MLVLDPVLPLTRLIHQPDAARANSLAAMLAELQILWQDAAFKDAVAALHVNVSYSAATVWISLTYGTISQTALAKGSPCEEAQLCSELPS